MAEQQNQQGVYLSKQGNVFGPFTRAQIEQLKRTGEYLNYSFIWDPASSPDWKPVHMPPAPPPSPEQVLPSRFAPAAHAAVPAAAVEPAARATPIPAVASLSQPLARETVAPAPQPLAAVPTPAAGSGAVELQAICHDNRQAVGGILVQPTSRGFTLLTRESSSTLPPFSQGSRVWINLLDEHTGQTENFQAAVKQVASQDGKWAFEIVWERPASMLSGRMSFPKF